MLPSPRISVDDSTRAFFERDAGSYEAYAHAQSHMAAHVMTCSLAHTKNPQSILELGCGTGMLTRALVRHYPDAEITAVDFSPAMIEQAADTATQAVNFRCQDIRDGVNETFDLIISSATLHWLEDLPSLLAGYRQKLNPNGRLIIGLMLEGTYRELQDARALAAPEKSVPQLPSFDFVNGLVPGAILAEQLQHRETFPSLESFFESLRKSGTTGGRFAHPETRLTRSELAKVKESYPPEADGKIRATYDMGFWVLS